MRQELIAALTTLGVGSEELDCLWSYVAAMLHLGNVDFGVDQR